MSSRNLPALALGLFAVSLAAPLSQAAAQAPGAMPPAAGGAALSQTDQTFVMKAAQGGMAEVQAAQLAQQKATSDGVKQFAQRMIDDHTKADDQLTKIVAPMGITPPAEPSPKEQKQYSMLESMSGPKFDHSYVRGELKDHKTMLHLFQQEASNGQNPQIKAFAEQTIPTLQEHLSMAQNLQSSK